MSLPPGHFSPCTRRSQPRPKELQSLIWSTSAILQQENRPPKAMPRIRPFAPTAEVNRMPTPPPTRSQNNSRRATARYAAAPDLGAGGLLNLPGRLIPIPGFEVRRREMRHANPLVGDAKIRFSPTHAADDRPCASDLPWSRCFPVSLLGATDASGAHEAEARLAEAQAARRRVASELEARARDGTVPRARRAEPVGQRARYAPPHRRRSGVASLKKTASPHRTAGFPDCSRATHRAQPRVPPRAQRNPATSTGNRGARQSAWRPVGCAPPNIHSVSPAPL